MIQITTELKAHFLRLYQMAVSDENFSPLEMKMLYQLAEDRGIPNYELDKILLSAEGAFPIPQAIETRIEYLYDMAKMAWADGVITDEEVSMLRKFCKKLEFLDENVDELAKYLLDSVEKGLSAQDIINELKA
ncbi:MAG: hypothetical protein ACK5L5_09320 [Bacteroidales bacterium]